MKKKMILSVVMVFLFSLFLIPSKIYAEELELEAESLVVTPISFATEEDFITYLSDMYGINLRAASSDKVTGSISFSKSSSEVYIMVDVDSVGGYASKVGMKNITNSIFQNRNLLNFILSHVIMSFIIE